MIPKRLRSQSIALLHDVLMIPAAWLLAYLLRFNLVLPPDKFINSSLFALAIILPIQFGSYFIFGLYRGVWRFASLPDIQRILKSVILGATIGMTLLFITTRGEGIPRSVPIIYTLLLILMLGGPRLIYRWIKDHHLYIKPGKRVLIVGSGQAGEMLVRDILRSRDSAFQPLAFVDDNPRRFGREIHGIPIVGKCDDIPSLVIKLQVEMIMLAIPSAKSRQIRKVVNLCEKTGLPIRTVPQLSDLMSGNVRVNELREVSIEDLLGRESVSLDWLKITQALSDKDILVTGGGGSIGSELCRQLAKLTPARLVIIENSEYNLYSIEMEFLKNFPNIELQCHLGDVTDQPFLSEIFKRHKPDIVFHAAAYKHVPLLQPQLRQALRNNVLGTRTVADAASQSQVETFVLVSTDKAVNPTSVMGASKRAAEIYCQNLAAHSQTKFITVRFGNVLGSAGSVIPLFRQQIASGGPVTVTDPRMERYFMTIPEACQLIMQTVVLGQGGEIFVLDMGEPIKISYLAEQMIRLSGKIPNEDIKIEFIGLRPGEKLYEELFHEKEPLEKTSHEKVFLAQHRKVDWQWLNDLLDQMATACDQLDTQLLQQQLYQLVPEQIPPIEPTTKSERTDVIYLNQ